MKREKGENSNGEVVEGEKVSNGIVVIAVVVDILFNGSIVMRLRMESNGK